MSMNAQGGPRQGPPEPRWGRILAVAGALWGFGFMFGAAIGGWLW